jgi:GNAT superfamily N-acetyltransferase
MMNPAVVYRTAQPADAPIVFDLVCALAEYERLRHEVVSTADDFKKLIETQDRFFCYLAEIDTRPVGFCMGFYTLSTFLGKPGLYIEDVYVSEDCRGLGIGKTFFKMVAQKALEEDCGRVEWSVLDWNEPSIKFYESLGAKPLSEWIKYRLDDQTIKQVAGL